MTTLAQLAKNPVILVDFRELGGPRLLTEPVRIWQAFGPAEVIPVVRQAEAAARAGGWVAGWLAYEAGAAFGLPTLEVSPLPLAWFAEFARSEPVVYSGQADRVWPGLLPPRPTMDPWDYAAAFARIQEAIQGGESYQVNLTVAAEWLSEVTLADFFGCWQAGHRFAYAAWIHLPDVGGKPLQMASFSPELLLSRQGNELVTGPIKGTRPRREDPEADEAQGRALEQSGKDQAEHIMIVDMARNDLGQVCVYGSVLAPFLLERRTIAGVHHLETRVVGRQRQGVDLAELLAALFPAASITGAPKHQAMTIIREVERRPRGIYCGSIGVLRPGGDAIFNVAIRTVTRIGEEPAQIGLGGGIVADSELATEWAEIAHKGRFLTQPPPAWGLCETLALTKDGQAPLWLAHRARLLASAQALGLPVAPAVLEAGLIEAMAQWYRSAGAAPGVVRLRLGQDGLVSATSRPMPPSATGLKVRLAEWRLDRLDPWLGHKTDRRARLDHELTRAIADGYEEVLFRNNLDRITEGAIRGIKIRQDGKWRVPPLADGLLPSLWRGEQLAAGAEEDHITLADLLAAEAIQMGNSVRGGTPVIRLDDANGVILRSWS